HRVERRHGHVDAHLRARRVVASLVVDHEVAPAYLGHDAIEQVVVRVDDDGLLAADVDVDVVAAGQLDAVEHRHRASLRSWNARAVEHPGSIAIGQRACTTILDGCSGESVSRVSERSEGSSPGPKTNTGATRSYVRKASASADDRGARAALDHPMWAMAR